MTREVRISAIEGTTIKAGCDQSACEGCKSSTFCRGRKDEFEILNPEGLELKVGDDVVIAMDGGRTVAATAISLAFPLLCFLIGLLLGRHWWPDSEPIQLLAALVLLLAGFAAAGIYFHFTRRHYMPTVRGKKEG